VLISPFFYEQLSHTFFVLSNFYWFTVWGFNFLAKGNQHKADRKMLVKLTLVVLYLTDERKNKHFFSFETFFNLH